MSDKPRVVVRDHEDAAESLPDFSAVGDDGDTTFSTRRRDLVDPMGETAARDAEALVKLERRRAAASQPPAAPAAAPAASWLDTIRRWLAGLR